MKGLQSIFLGIFGIFAFSWIGMALVPQLQIGHLDPQSDEEGTDVYPLPPSGMAMRGAQVYAANGCFYCHSQQVRPEYGGSDLERKWGERRSAPRDYIFERVVFLGKTRLGPDLANVGHRPALQEKGAAAPAGSPGTATSPAPNDQPAAPNANPAPPSSAASPAAVASATPGAAGPAAAGSPAEMSASPAAPASPASGGPAMLPAAGTQPAANIATSAPAMVADTAALTAEGNPLPYTAAWHHRHLYNPRSIVAESNMPSYHFLYEKHRISGEASGDAINFGGESPKDLDENWEIVPSYDAKCLVAYLMSLDQSHPLKEAKSPVVAAAPAPAAEKEAQK